MIGPGKYDDLATVVRGSAGAKGVVLMVFSGRHGSGFSVQAETDVVWVLPEILRSMADEIERDTWATKPGEGTGPTGPTGT